MSARSTNARSMACVMLDVVSTMTLGLCRSASICVKSAFTTRMASLGSEPLAAAARAAASDSTSSTSTKTRHDSSSHKSPIFSNRRETSLPLSENHRLNSECALTSTKVECGYAPLCRIASRCAKALHRVVLPVPGGPCRSTTRFHAIKFGSTRLRLNSKASPAYVVSRVFTGRALETFLDAFRFPTSLDTSRVPPIVSNGSSSFASSSSSSSKTSASHWPWKSRLGSGHSLYVAMSSSPSISSPPPSSSSWNT